MNISIGDRRFGTIRIQTNGQEEYKKASSVIDELLGSIQEYPITNTPIVLIELMVRPDGLDQMVAHLQTVLQ